MAKKYGRSTTVSQQVYDWLDAYKESKGLRSIAQAVEFVIREAGYDFNEPATLAVRATE